MPSPFEFASAIAKVGEGRFTGNIPAGWDQGRGAFGGLVLGLLARAMEACEPDRTRTLRTLIGDITGPVLVGPIDLIVRTNRRGNSQSNLEVHLEQNGEVLALGSAVFASPRKAVIPEFDTDKPPAAIDWNQVPVAPVRAPQGPAFGQYLEFRPMLGVPYSNATNPEVAGYVRLQGQDRPLDIPDLIALLDAHWPGVIAMGLGPRATATVSFAGQIFCDPQSLDWRVPLYYRSKIVAKHTGYFLELRELWQNGNCVAMNQQTLAMIK